MEKPLFATGFFLSACPAMRLRVLIDSHAACARKVYGDHWAEPEFIARYRTQTMCDARSVYFYREERFKMTAEDAEHLLLKEGLVFIPISAPDEKRCYASSEGVWAATVAAVYQDVVTALWRHGAAIIAEGAVEARAATALHVQNDPQLSGFKALVERIATGMRADDGYAPFYDMPSDALARIERQYVVRL